MPKRRKNITCQNSTSSITIVSKKLPKDGLFTQKPPENPVIAIAPEHFPETEKENIQKTIWIDKQRRACQMKKDLLDAEKWVNATAPELVAWEVCRLRKENKKLKDTLKN